MKTIAWVVALAAIVTLGFLWKHDSDAKRDGRISVLDAERDTLHHQIDSLTAHSHELEQRVDRGVDTVTVAVTKWHTHSDSVPVLVQTIVHDTVADSTKVRELAVLVLETKAKGDTLARAVDSLRPAVIDLRRVLAEERDARQRDASKAATEIALLKKQSSRWGLGGSFGYDPTHIVWRKPRLLAGIVFRY